MEGKINICVLLVRNGYCYVVDLHIFIVFDVNYISRRLDNGIIRSTALSGIRQAK